MSRGSSSGQIVGEVPVKAKRGPELYPKNWFALEANLISPFASLLTQRQSCKADVQPRGLVRRLPATCGISSQFKRYFTIWPSPTWLPRTILTICRIRRVIASSTDLLKCCSCRFIKAQPSSLIPNIFSDFGTAIESTNKRRVLLFRYFVQLYLSRLQVLRCTPICHHIAITATPCLEAGLSPKEFRRSARPGQ
jgi:hypothetical protein